MHGKRCKRNAGENLTKCQEQVNKSKLPKALHKGKTNVGGDSTKREDKLDLKTLKKNQEGVGQKFPQS